MQLHLPVQSGIKSGNFLICLQEVQESSHNPIRVFEQFILINPKFGQMRYKSGTTAPFKFLDQNTTTSAQKLKGFS